MKRMLALALALLVCGCALAEGNWYVDEGQALALRMQALAADDVYTGLMMAGRDEETTALKEGFARADLSRPTGAWFLPLPEEATLFSALLQLAAASGEDLDLGAFIALSDVGREELVKRLPASAASILISRSGVSWVALSSLLSVSEAVEEPEDYAPGYLLLEYPGDYAVLLTFTRPLPGYAAVGATLAPAGCLETIRPVLDYAQMLGLPVELEEVEAW